MFTMPSLHLKSPNSRPQSTEPHTHQRSALSQPQAYNHLKDDQSGMTLLEIIIVVALLGALMGVLVTSMLTGQDTTKEDISRLGMGEIAQALQLYRVHNNRFPTAEQGLSALVLNPGTMPRWRGPYLEEDKLKDPWGENYDYEISGRNFKIISAGIDGEMGTADDITYPDTTGSDDNDS